MSHDITAYNNVDRDALIDEMGDGYDFDEYRRLTEVANLRRNAFSKLNVVIYKVLDVMDAHCGSSGCQETRYFNLEQLEASLDKLQRMGNDEFASLVRPKNSADELLEKFPDAEKVPDHGDIRAETSFLQSCIEYLQANEAKEIEIHFG